MGDRTHFGGHFSTDSAARPPRRRGICTVELRFLNEFDTRRSGRVAARLRHPARRYDASIMDSTPTIDPASAVPASAQLHDQLRDRIHSGELASGSRLPTVRALADELGLAANTVAKTYRELERDGLIETRGRNGTVVAWSSDGAERDAQQAAAAYAERMRALGIDAERAVQLARAALREPA